MDQNPIVDIANNLKQGALEIKIQSIQDDMRGIKHDMSNLMVEMTKLSEQYLRLNQTLESVEKMLDKPTAIGTPTSNDQTYIK